MSEKSRVTVKPEAKSDNPAFHALTPHLSQSAHSPFGIRSLITPLVQRRIEQEDRELSGRTHEDSRNQGKDASSISKGHDFSRVRVYPKCTVGGLPIQPKLRINEPGDLYELEADRVAEQVMRMPEPGVQRQVEHEDEEEEMLLAKPLTEEITPLVQRQVEPEEEEEELQAKSISGHISEVNPNLESHIQFLKGSGQPLPESARAHFEPRFGRDFSQVRVHTDANAAELAQAVNARAFTVGQDVVFGTGEYAPGTSEGRRLMAHELVHAVQQSDLASNRLRYGTTRDSQNLRVEEKELIQTKARSEQITPLVQHQEEEKLSYKQWLIIGDLKKALKRVGVEVSPVRDSNGKIIYYKVPTPLGEEKVAEGNLLKELKMLAALYKITPEYRNYTPPAWLSSEAQEFWNRAVRHEIPKDGCTIKSFGDEITITNAVIGEKIEIGSEVVRREEYSTREEIIWIWVTSGRTTQIQAFKYLPTKKNAYDSKIKYMASIDYNFSMYYYIEKQKLSPEEARDKLNVVNKEVLRLMIRLIIVSAIGP